MPKISFKKEDLLRAIESCLGSLEKKSTMPILSHLLFDQTKDECRIAATNLDTSVFVMVPVQGSGKVRMAV